MSARRDEPALGRREFFGISAAAVATAWLGACHDDILAPLSQPRFAKPPSGGAARNPLQIPPVAAPQASNGRYLITAAPGTAPLGGGQTTQALLYNGGFPGPTLVANSGDAVSLRFVNGLSQKSIVHWHGMIVNHANDGTHHNAVNPGGAYNYDYTINQRAALNWYHPHPHMTISEQVFYGLAGAFIVRDSTEQGLGLPAGPPYEVPLIIRDAAFNSAGNLSLGNKSSGFWGTEPLVNATRAPYHPVNKGVYRFRVLNGCNARVWRLAFSDNRYFTLIGNDGGLLPSAVQLNQITLSPGERADIIVSFSSLNVGQSVMLRCVAAGWDIIQFRGTGSIGTGTVPNGTLSTITALNGPATPTRTFSFDGMTKINGKVYQMDRIDFQVPRATVERWRFRTNGNAPHPVHVHGAHFQVQSRSGGRNQVFPWEGGWKDTVLLEDKETVDVLIRFDIAGKYVMHCHQLAHEDQGMMTDFMVV